MYLHRKHRGRKRPIYSSSYLDIYSRIWSAALFPVSPPPRPPMSKYLLTVCGWEGMWDVVSTPPAPSPVLSRVGDHILQEFYSLYVTRFRTCKVAYPPQDKNLEGEGASKQITSCRRVLLKVTSVLRRKNCALPSMSYLYTIESHLFFKQAVPSATKWNKKCLNHFLDCLIEVFFCDTITNILFQMWVQNTRPLHLWPPS